MVIKWNAYTSNDVTCFIYSSSEKNFFPSLNIKFNELINFKAEGDVKGEINAVNSEFVMDAANIAWKLNLIESYMMDPSHPASKFNIGSFKSLDKKGLTENMLKFYNELYGLDRMTVVTACNDNVLENSYKSIESVLNNTSGSTIQKITKKNIDSLKAPKQEKDILLLVKNTGALTIMMN